MFKDLKLEKINYNEKIYYIIANENVEIKRQNLYTFLLVYQINKSVDKILKKFNGELIRIVKNLLDGLLNSMLKEKAKEKAKTITFKNEEDGLKFIDWLNSIMTMEKIIK